MSGYEPRPEVKAWTLDEPGSERYDLVVCADGHVLLAYGRHAQGSGAGECSWRDFLAGTFDDLVAATMGESVLAEARALVRQLRRDQRRRPS